MHIPKPLLDKYNTPVPRYTSYPPANYFHAGVTSEQYLELIESSNHDEPSNISFYVHIPFCAQICLYCGCNQIKLGEKSAVDIYLEALKKEIQTITAHLDKNRKVSQIHYGGGTPNILTTDQLWAINDIFHSQFEFTENPEIAIECHPAHLDFAYIDGLVNAGFNRISIGVQDFDERILANVHRLPSRLPIEDLVTYIREKHPELGVNLDFIYGLPGQTTESFLATIERAIQIRPDRLVTFSYAHVPWVKKYQLALEKIGLPTAEDKMEMFARSRAFLRESGYIEIGMDHYVLPWDELEVALQNHTLHRNFQGYATRDTTGQVYAFGTSAITQLTGSYIQNVKDIETYTATLEAGQLPIEKGYVLNQDEIVIRDIITELMCNGYLDFSIIANRYNQSTEDIKKLTKFSPNMFDEFVADGLMEYENDIISVTELGMFFIRNIATTLNPAYTEGKGVYSKLV